MDASGCSRRAIASHRGENVDTLTEARYVHCAGVKQDAACSEYSSEYVQSPVNMKRSGLACTV